MKTAYFLSGALAATVGIFFITAIQELNNHDEIIKEWRNL